MCGHAGDPAAAPDTIEIFNHFRTINDKMRFTIHSNGSLRNTAWWSELGNILSRETDRCYFSIDGLADTNHIYRVNTLFDKIMENAKAFIKNGGKAHWEYIVFEHNEHQVEEARNTAMDLGFVSFREKVSRRFKLVPNTNVRPPKGKKYDIM
jgi:sulfatase maturation enzyme AslB (radical SAM superfamily)